MSLQSGHPNRTTFLDLPVEVRQMIWDLVYENSQVLVGYYGIQQPNRPIIRRYITQGSGADQTYVPDYPPHSLAYIHPRLNAELQQQWFNSRLTLSETSFIPAGIFHGITHLSLPMDSAVRGLQVVVPYLPKSHNDPNPPNTLLVLKHAPNVQNLEIHWKTTFETWYEHEEQDVAVLMARLQYFNRSFRAVVRIEAFLENGTIAARGSLLDDPVDFEKHRDAGFSFQEERDFVLRIKNLKWNPLCLTRPNSNQRKAVIEAHPYHNCVSLGWRSFEFSNFRLRDDFRATARSTPRPYDD